MVKKLLLWLLPSLLAVVLAMIGYMAGRYSVINPFTAQLAHYESTETLGKLLANPAINQNLSERQKTKYYTAYDEGEGVIASVDGISWGVKNILTPFVGNAPWPGEQFNATINDHQFRDRHEPVMPKPDTTYRVFITGGSTAYGSGSPDQDSTIGAYLELLLQQELAAKTGLKYEVFTFANPAWASTHERIVIENRLSELAPDKVISLSGNNDVFWAAAGRNVMWFRTFADDFFWQLVNSVYQLSGQAPMPDVIAVSDQSVTVALIAERLVKNIRLAQQALQISAPSAAYVFALQPTLAVTRKPLTAREQDFINAQQTYYQQAYQAIDEQFITLQLDHFNYLNLATVFDQLGAEDIFIDSFHFADKGNRLIAAALFEQIFMTAAN